MPDTKPSLLRRLLSIPVEIIVAIYIVLDGIVAPLFWPLVRWLSSLRIIQRVEKAIGSLPPYVILVLLVVPFAIAEVTKAYAVILMASGHFRTGLIMMISAYILSVVFCERTLHAGRDQLMTIGWFKILFDWVMAIKDHLLDWFRRTRVWKLAETFRQRARIALRRTRARLRSTIGPKPKGLFERR